MENRLTPPFAGLAAVIGFAYGLWAAAAFHASAIEHNNEIGVMAMYVFMVIIFAVVVAAAGWLWGAAMEFFEGAVTRSVVGALALAIFLGGYGRPSLIVLGIAAFIYLFGVLAERRKQQDEQDLADFLDQ